VRPHDVLLSTLPDAGSEEALVERVSYLGFEVRAQLVFGEGGRFDAQLTHDEAERLELAPGQIVFARLVRRPRLGVADEVANAVG
jgi:sulfate transport system ATP-binding protein